MYYAYIIESINIPTQHYIGYTSNLKQRILHHNAGKSYHTRKFLPWKIKTYFAFEKQETALKFERYLKSGSGHSFAKRHFGF